MIRKAIIIVINFILIAYFVGCSQNMDKKRSTVELPFNQKYNDICLHFQTDEKLLDDSTFNQNVIRDLEILIKNNRIISYKLIYQKCGENRLLKNTFPKSSVKQIDKLYNIISNRVDNDLASINVKTAYCDLILKNGEKKKASYSKMDILGTRGSFLFEVLFESK